VTNIREGSAKGHDLCIFITTRDSSKDHIVRCETEPEFKQWSKDLVQAWCQAKRLLKKGPKLISMQRSVAEEANFNKGKGNAKFRRRNSKTQLGNIGRSSKVSGTQQQQSHNNNHRCSTNNQPPAH
jgi:hypothetical protein